MNGWLSNIANSLKNILVEVLRVVLFVLIFLSVIEVIRLIFRFIFKAIAKIFHQDKIWVYAFWGVGSILVFSLAFAIIIGTMNAVGTFLGRRHPHSREYPTQK